MSMVNDQKVFQIISSSNRFASMLCVPLFDSGELLSTPVCVVSSGYSVIRKYQMKNLSLFENCITQVVSRYLDGEREAYEILMANISLSFTVSWLKNRKGLK